MDLRFFYSFFLIVALGACSQTMQTPLKEPNPLAVTVAELNTDPDFFHDKRIKVRGFLAKEAGSFILFDSMETYFAWFEWQRETKTGAPVAINISERVKPENNSTYITADTPVYPDIFYQRAEVELIGTFDSSERTDDENDRYISVIIGSPKLVIREVEELKVLDRPLISGLVIKELHLFRNKNLGIEPWLKAMAPTHLDSPAMIQLTENWLNWMAEGDLENLKRTNNKKDFYYDHWVNLDNPDHFYYHLLFNKNSVLQRFLSRNDTFSYFFLEPFETHDGSGDELSSVCFCEEEDCQRLAPITTSQLAFPGAGDDFVCIGLVKTQGRWEWDY